MLPNFMKTHFKFCYQAHDQGIVLCVCDSVSKALEPKPAVVEMQMPMPAFVYQL